MSNLRRSIVLLIVVAIGAGCGKSRHAEDKNAILVLAAASLAPTLDSIAVAFERRYDLPVRIGYGASGTLAQQIRAGASADLYLSADTAWIERLQTEDSTLINRWWPILTNHLVVAALSKSTFAMPDFSGLADSAIRHIVIADPQAAPAGRYAKASLEYAGLWDAVSSKLVYAEHVTAAVQVIRTGVADVGMAYATDIAPYPELKVVCTVPDSLHPPIVYGLAMLRPATGNKNTSALAEFIRSDPEMSLFRRAGFIPTQNAPTQRP